MNGRNPHGPGDPAPPPPPPPKRDRLTGSPPAHTFIRPELDTQDDNDVWRRQENVKRVLTVKGVRLHDSVIEAIVEAACDPSLRPQSSVTEPPRTARHDKGQIEDRALTPEEVGQAMQAMVEEANTYGVFMGERLWCICPGNGIDRAKLIAQGVEQFG